MKIDWANPAELDLELYRSDKLSHFFSDKLKDLPKIGRIVPEAERDDIRELLFHGYRVIYHIEAERILILAVIHGARQLSTLKTKPWEII